MRWYDNERLGRLTLIVLLASNLTLLACWLVA